MVLRLLWIHRDDLPYLFAVGFLETEAISYHLDGSREVQLDGSWTWTDEVIHRIHYGAIRVSFTFKAMTHKQQHKIANGCLPCISTTVRALYAQRIGEQELSFGMGVVQLIVRHAFGAYMSFGKIGRILLQATLVSAEEAEIAKRANRAARDAAKDDPCDVDIDLFA